MAKDDNIVVSCGGGFGVNCKFCEEKKQTFGEIQKDILAKTDAIKLLFEVSENCLIERIKTDKKRPKFDKKNDYLEEQLNVFEERKSAYKSLDYDVKIDTSYDNFANAIQEKSLFCVIGNPVWHSLSPRIHNSFFEKISYSSFVKTKNFVYTKMEIAEKSFDKIADILRIFNIRGASITMPYKQKIIPFLEKIDEKSEKIGAVNTIIFDEKKQKYFGYNTDFYGVHKALQKNIGDFSNKRIAIFGSGGASHSAVIGCFEEAKNVELFNRTPEKNAVFAEKNDIKNHEINEFKSENFDIIINATSVGLNENKSIISKEKLDNHVVFDMVYSPLKTRLLRDAVEKNCKIIYGTEMLVYQAKKQFEMFCDVEINDEICEQILQEIQPKNHKICVVVRGESVEEFLKNLCEASKHSDFVELRFDYIKGLSVGDIEVIANEAGNIKKERKMTNRLNFFETIFTCRMKKNGGEFCGKSKENRALVEYAMSLNVFDFFDFDISSVKHFSKFLNAKRNWKSIVSYHNFQGCLPFWRIKKMIIKMQKIGDLPKIAVKIKNLNDEKIMKKVFDFAKKEEKNIIFAPMGSPENRALAWKLGSWTNFICLNEKEKTADGQICVDDLEKLGLNL